MKVSTSKVTQDVTQGNQNKVTVTQNKNIVTVTGKLAQLTAFVSSDAEQAALGPCKWVALDIDTGETDIVNTVKWGDYTLSAVDKAEAENAGLDGGHILFWFKADKGTVEQTLTLVDGSKSPVKLTFRFQERSSGGGGGGGSGGGVALSSSSSANSNSPTTVTVTTANNAATAAVQAAKTMGAATATAKLQKPR